MTLRVDIDHLRRVLAASLPAGARAAELFIESRLEIRVVAADGRAARPDPLVERRWETGAHLRRFSEGRHESFVLDAPTAASLEALAAHPEAVAVPWLTGAAPEGAPRRPDAGIPIEARLADASPGSPGGPWSESFLTAAAALLADWTGRLAADPGIAGATASLEGCVQEILILATDRDPARDTRCFTDATMRARAARDGGGILLIENRSASSIGQLASLARDEDHPAARLARRARQAHEASPAPGGEMPVVFAPPSGGFLLHEICGHLLEADHVLRGASPFAAARGRAVASPLLTLADDGSVPGMRGSTLFDDEGVAARRTPLIMDGTLVGYLSDRLTAVATDGISTGNGRRQSYRDAPMPRMTNLVIDNGRGTLDGILADTPAGLLVTRLGRGRVDPATGRFALGVEEGFLIEAGRAGRPVSGAVLRGRAADLLPAIDAVGGDARPDTGSPLCVKDDQALPFGILQPTLRVAGVTVTDR